MNQPLHFEPTLNDVNPEVRLGGDTRFDPLDYQDFFKVSATDAATMARKARDRLLREARAKWPQARFKGWTLTGQLRQYRSFGAPDGRIRSVYYITLYRSNI